jgi:sugar phosphate isomerase/epimerase
MMFKFPIGVLLDSFKTDIDTALKSAVEVGAKGIQVYSTYGELAPQNLTGTKRREFLKKVKDRGLVISALCGDLGHGFGDASKNPELIEQSKRIMYLAKELETDVITTHIGVIPADEKHPRYKIMQEACNKLAEFADSLEAHFAVETGPESSIVLKIFLDSLGSKGVGVNLDPANLVMVTGDDPVQAVYNLQNYIVHTHAKDGRKLMDKDPEIIYGLKPNSVEGEIKEGAAFTELPLGKGDVDFNNYLKSLNEIGYRGFLTIEREVGEDPKKDIMAAVEFLNEKMGVGI